MLDFYSVVALGDDRALICHETDVARYVEMEKTYAADCPDQSWIGHLRARAVEFLAKRGDYEWYRRTSFSMTSWDRAVYWAEVWDEFLAFFEKEDEDGE